MYINENRSARTINLPITGLKDVHGVLQQDNAPKDLDKTFNTRITIFIFAAMVIGIMIIYKILVIQSKEFIEKAQVVVDQELVYYDQIVYPERGKIYDKNGYLLAGNKTVYEVGVNLADVKNPTTIAEVLSNQLGISKDEVLFYANINNHPEGQRYYPLAYSVEIEEIQKLQAIREAYNTELKKSKKDDPNAPNLAGLTWKPYLERNYPEHTLASNVLGFVNFLDTTNGEGHYGVEEKYNDRLAGKPERVKILLDPNATNEIPVVPAGESFYLTIDREIQSMTEETLDAAVAKYGAKSGTIIIMDPKTGEILAMAVSPRRDPNFYYEKDERFDKKTPYNKAISNPYEPGSVFKPITMAGALNKGIVTPETTFYDSGSYYIGGWYLYNWDKSAHGEQTMTGCLQLSLNVCLAWVADQMGPQLFYDNLISFGLNRPTGIDLAGEEIYPVKLPGDKEWFDVNLGTNSYGQGISLTPIQMITALSAIANDGKMMQPHVVKASYFRDTYTENTPVAINNPISKETADTLSEMLAVSLEKESSLALVPGYRIAGKTGTASIVNPETKEYYEDKTNASFVGWGPVDDPQFIVYVWIEEPATGEWGSVVAAPVFSEVVQKLVILLQIPPDDIRLGTTAINSVSGH